MTILREKNTENKHCYSNNRFSLLIGLTLSVDKSTIGFGQSFAPLFFVF